MSTLPGLPESDATAEVVYVDIDIVHVPSVRLHPCACGRERTSPDPHMVELARRGDELPPVSCSCGRVVIGQRNLIRTAKVMQ